MSNDNFDTNKNIHNFLCMLKPEIELYGSSKCNPIKTDDTGRLIVTGKAYGNLTKSFLIESGKLQLQWQNYNS